MSNFAQCLPFVSADRLLLLLAVETTVIHVNKARTTFIFSRLKSLSNICKNWRSRGAQGRVLPALFHPICCGLIGTNEVLSSVRP